MKYNMCAKRLTAVFILMIPFLIGMVHAQGNVKLAVAALNLPPDEDGLLHWRDGNKPTEPLQLSIRYFSEFLSLESGVLRFYADPVVEDPQGSPPVEPLYTLRIPPGPGIAFLVLTTQSDGDKFSWRGQLIPGEDLELGSMKLFNASNQVLGIQLPDGNVKLSVGKSVDLDSKRFSDSFPVKIYQLGDDPKKIFSSVWRISPHRRELCFVYRRNHSLKLRSLLFLAPAREQQ